jgi:hypothetical protein
VVDFMTTGTSSRDVRHSTAAQGQG